MEFGLAETSEALAMITLMFVQEWPQELFQQRIAVISGKEAIH